ncbi:hypothetical protein DAEQUDRAFT_213378 [Daedalea quercina L-15889]|uniref:Uncharacterized protein n=1 Tax=Daedalea quercina L-15889 TaxID=1314783 RepID=A0A165R348_9APHY|nr:hypothetical protein DAEQUDRAFT_213378 [Daedalea quercina L-15889]
MDCSLIRSPRSYRIHLSPGSRRGSGSATRAAMTKAKTSAEQLAQDSVDSSPRNNRLIGISASANKQGLGGSAGANATVTPSPSSSPSDLRAQTLPASNYASQYPEPPDTPPPLVPAIVHPGYAYPVPPGTASSCSSTPSIPELQYASASGQARPHVQVDFTSARSSHSHSPEQNYASSAQSHSGGSTYASPTDQTVAWVYNGHAVQYQHQQYQPHQQHQQPPHSQRTKSLSPAQRTQSAHQHAIGAAQYGYDYSENYQLQYPATPPGSSLEYAHPVAASSRHSLAHVSPSRPPMAMLGAENVAAYPDAGARFDGSASTMMSRYIGGGASAPAAGPSAHHDHAAQGSLVEYAATPSAGGVGDPSRAVYAGYGNAQGAHRYTEQDDGTAAYYAAGYGTSGRSPPPTLPPIQTGRVVRDDIAVDTRHAQHPSALDAAHAQAPFSYPYHQQQHQHQHMSTEHPHLHPQAQVQDRPLTGQPPLDVPLHQPRPHYSPQQYGAFYASTAGASASGGGGGAPTHPYYRRDSHDNVVAR